MVQHNTIDHTGVPGVSSGSVATDAIWDAKGDLAGGTGANTAQKLTVGANGKILQAQSGETTGLKWVVPNGTLLAVVYNTASGNDTTNSTTQADVDASNAVISFTVPDSGKILFRAVVECFTPGGAVANQWLGIRESTTDIVNKTFAHQSQAADFEELVTWEAYVTGLTPGDAKTYKLAFASNSSVNFTVRGSSGSPMTLSVWAAP